VYRQLTSASIAPENKKTNKHACNKNIPAAYNSKHLTALENVGTGVVYCKRCGLVISSLSRGEVLHNTHLHREFVSFPPHKTTAKD